MYLLSLSVYLYILVVEVTPQEDTPRERRITAVKRFETSGTRCSIGKCCAYGMNSASVWESVVTGQRMSFHWIGIGASVRCGDQPTSRQSRRRKRRYALTSEEFLDAFSRYPPAIRCRITQKCAPLTPNIPPQRHPSDA